MKKYSPHSLSCLVRSTMSLAITTLLFVLSGQFLFAQNVSINTDGTPPDSSAILDISADDKGVLIPRVALTGPDDTTTIESPQLSLFVYNTATTEAISPGYYYWDGDIWSRLSTMWRQDSTDIYYDQGNVGIGTKAPDHLLEVIGNSGVEYEPAAYFENTLDSIDGERVHGFGVMGVSDTVDGYGFGVYGLGGLVGVRGRVFATDTFSYFGVAGAATGGGGENYGVWGLAYGDSTNGINVGLGGSASGPGRNMGVEARASGGHTNYAIFGSAQDTSASSQTYAGFFEGDVHISDRLGIGVYRPIQHKLEVVGKSGVSHQPIAYFENLTDTVDGQLVDAYGVMGVCDRSDWAGYGGKFRGGYIGVLGEVFPTDTFSYFGVRGIASGGSGINFGTQGYANGDGTNVGARGRADGTDVNYGLWGYAKSGLTNYAVYGIVDTTGVSGTFAGYFEGDVSVFGRLGIGTEEPAVAAHLFSSKGAGILRLESSFTGNEDRGTIEWYTEQNTDTWAAKIGPSTHPDDLGLVIATNFPGEFGNQKDIVFKTSDQERMRIKSNGRVGIGITNPGVRLEVEGETWLNSETVLDDNLILGRTTLDNHILFNGSAGNTILKIFPGDFWIQSGAGVKTRIASGDEFRIQTYDAGYQDRIFVKKTGEVGVGTILPHGDFQINDHLVFQRTSSDLDYVIANNLHYNAGWKYLTSEIGSVFSLDDNGGFGFGNAPVGTAGGSATITNRFYIKSNGNIGIGTTTPAAMLDVTDTIQTGGLKMATGASSGHVLTSDASGNASWEAPPTTGLVPIGAILPWAKSISGMPSLPSGFVECQGQTLSDTGSPLNGQTLPDLNGRFLRGAASSGGTGGSDDHSHSGNTSSSSDPPVFASEDSPNTPVARDDHTHGFVTDVASTLPTYYQVVWIMRVK